MKYHGVLPEYYITKEKAKQMGWIPTKGNLHKIAPGKMICGVYYNDDEKLPDKHGRIWYEADINYESGRRNRERILFSNDGLIFVTYDHYETFIAVEYEEKKRMEYISLDFSECGTIGEIHREIETKFEFPDYYGKNLSALWDCLDNYCNHRLHVIIKGYDDLSKEFDDYKEKMWNAFCRVTANNPLITFEKI